jgi:peptide-methionine (R)-S-oxide reductase
MKLSDTEWRTRLSPEQYEVCRCSATEPPFANEYWDCHDAGSYCCAACGAELFDSETKFDSGTGWPSFSAPVADGAVAEREDDSLGVRRTEVVCAGCESHLGHIFLDGPQPTGLRFCINSAALSLKRR